MNEEKETYSMEAHCNNCHDKWSVAIPKGRSVSVYEKSIICPNCGLGDIDVRPQLGFGIR